MPVTNAVVDVSHHNGTPNFKQAKASGLVGVIQKASQGTTYADPTYKTNRDAATAAGLLWGAYHFATGGDGVQQAEFFLKTVKPKSDTLLVLDIEHNPTGPSMSLMDAHAFVTHIQQVTGKWPGLYGGSYIKELLGATKDPVLGSCWFWLAQYSATAVVPITWPTWTMWQYTDGAAGKPPYTVPGIGACDRDQFQGSAQDLQAFWMSGVSPVAAVPTP